MHIDDGKAFGAGIKAKRLERGLPLRDAAQLMGTTSSSLSSWERGKLPRGVALVKVLKFYGITATIGVPPVAEVVS